jgi:ABC-2 type transport system ATP-binding protein
VSLDVSHLTKRYDAVRAVDDVSFTIDPGEILGYLGPNGSGKSTTINIIVGLLDATSGSVSLFNRRLNDDPETYKQRIGYVPEEPHLYTYLTAGEYLALVGGLRGIPKAELDAKISSLLRLFGLWDSRYSAMAAFSKGMRQRVLLSAALLHSPDLLVLDEPFSGLDVNAAFLFRTLLRLFVEDGRMILFSSHRLDIVEKICSRAVILFEGRLVAERMVGGGRGASSDVSLEEVFARSTHQDDYTTVAREILHVVRS